MASKARSWDYIIAVPLQTPNSKESYRGGYIASRTDEIDGELARTVGLPPKLNIEDLVLAISEYNIKAIVGAQINFVSHRTDYYSFFLSTFFASFKKRLTRSLAAWLACFSLWPIPFTVSFTTPRQTSSPF